jgi:hypothetical protein
MLFLPYLTALHLTSATENLTGFPHCFYNCLKSLLTIRFSVCTTEPFNISAGGKDIFKRKNALIYIAAACGS